MKIKEITELADKDLREKLEQAEEALKHTKLNHQVSPLENPSLIKAARRDIARMKTVLRQRELNK
ncbi:50S ribosomal protein L29 [Hallella sp.]|uniref:50S ribosomal protein L29 n=1 Tax=Hallella sp. TaxID=2980186 RepID=UPI00307A9CB1